MDKTIKSVIAVKPRETVPIFLRSQSVGDKIYTFVCRAFIWFVVVVTLYPFIYVLSCSISEPISVMQNKVILFPVGFSVDVYKKILAYPPFTQGYLNTIFYAVFGTMINMAFTTLMAYPLSRSNLFARKYFMFIISITLLFSGGIIPTYLVVNSLGLIDTRWAMLLPGAISTWNLILMRTFFQSIPDEMVEAAKIDGATEMQTFWHIMLPLSQAALATITLYYAVGHWNAYFSALIYLNKPSLQPIQVFLRNIIAAAQTADLIDYTSVSANDLLMGEAIKYATIVVVATPIIVAYPFIQKYFVQGVMIGSLKG